MYLMSLESLLRNYLERLPLPQHAILRTLKAYEGARKWFNKVESHKSAIAAKAARKEETADDGTEKTKEVKRPEFQNPANLPMELRKEEAWERIRCYLLLAYAAFGDEDPHLQTAADSCMSSNAPLRLDTFGKWGEDVACSGCRIRMPCMFFPNACFCDKDRLKAVYEEEQDHMKACKKVVIGKLGRSDVDEPVKSIDQHQVCQAFRPQWLSSSAPVGR